MQSLREFYKIGNGPSSSHTMGPKRAAEWFKNKNIDADRFDVYLYGSLAFTGKGHLTDKIIKDTLQPVETNIIFDMKFKCKIHPNTMDLVAFKDGKEIDRQRVYSVGGGTIKIEGQKETEIPNIYKLTTLKEIKKYCRENNKDLADYVFQTEDKEFPKYLEQVWKTMQNCVKEGLKVEGIIPGKLQIERKAKTIYEHTEKDRI